MAPPTRPTDPETDQELRTLRDHARRADAALWIAAATALHEQRVTAAAAARTLDISEATLWRKVKPWSALAAARALRPVDEFGFPTSPAPLGDAV